MLETDLTGFVLICSAVALFAGWFGVLVYAFVGGELRRNGYDPVDYDALQRELDVEFAPIAQLRRVEIAARNQ